MEFLKIDEVLQKLKISRSHLYSLMKNDTEFPSPIKLSKKILNIFQVYLNCLMKGL